MKLSQWIVLVLSVITLAACGGGSDATQNKTNPDNPDTVAPTLTVNGENPLAVVAGNAYVESGATAIDDRDGDVLVTISGTVNSDSVGTYNITYSASDDSGNTAEKIRVVEVVSTSSPDEVAPVITINGNNPMTLVSGNAYAEAGATAIDDRDGDVLVTISGTVNSDSVGTYNITYTALDSAGNTSSDIRTIYVTQATIDTAPRHVKPSDIGVTIGVGANGSAIPTEVYTGSKTITTPTTIENKIINGCLWIQSDDVTVRNTIINCDGYSVIRMDNEYRNFKIEYSKLECTVPLQGAKSIKASGGSPNAFISHNEFKGCEDFIFIDGDIDGTVIKNNYLHDVTGIPLLPGEVDIGKTSHSDGIQMGELSVAKGKLHIQGNYFEPNSPDIPKTALIFATHDSEVDILMEDNYIDNSFGTYTIRCMNKTKCDIRNNVFSNEYVTESYERILLTDSTEQVTFSCNRYENGNFVEKFVNEKDVLAGIEHTITNCDEINTSTNSKLQKRNLKEVPTINRFVRPLDKVWPVQANDIDIALWKNDKFASVSISIDDNIIDDHDFWIQISQQYGWKFTWFVIVNNLGAGSPTYGDWSDFQTLFNQGHDIESHTMSHQDDDHLRADSEIISEYKDSLIQINQNISGNDAQTIAYPHGDFKREIASQFSIAGRDTSLGINKPEKTDYLGVSSTSIAPRIDFIDAILKGTSSNSETHYMGNNNYIRGWYLTHFHKLYDRVSVLNSLALLEQNSDDLWVGLFKDVAKYGQERDTASIEIISDSTSKLVFNLSDDMDDTLFDYPLTLKIKLHSHWSTVSATQNSNPIDTKIITHENEKFILIQAIPDKGLITLQP